MRDTKHRRLYAKSPAFGYSIYILWPIMMFSRGMRGSEYAHPFEGRFAITKALKLTAFCFCDQLRCERTRNAAQSTCAAHSLINRNLLRAAVYLPTPLISGLGNQE